MKDWQKVEAVLFGSGRYLTEDEISLICSIPKKNLKKALNDVKKHYDEMDSSLSVFNENDAWKLNVKEEYSTIVKGVISEAEMPKAIMETLALIAYKSPVMQSEIIDMRGSGAYDHIGLLEDKGFITKEKFGRTFKIRISQKFYDYFDINSDKKLREMFKGVKKPENLGTLEVYTRPDKTTEEQEAEYNDKVLERMKKVEENPVDHEERKKFLDDFEKKFAQTKTNIDLADNEMNEFRKIIPQTEGENENSNSQTQSTQENQEAKLNETGTNGEDILKRFNEEVDKLVNQDDDETEEKDVKDDDEDIDFSEKKKPLKKKSKK